jgi:hypothetical protein
MSSTKTERILRGAYVRGRRYVSVERADPYWEAKIEPSNLVSIGAIQVPYGTFKCHDPLPYQPSGFIAYGQASQFKSRAV